MNWWPMRRPVWLGCMLLYGHRSLPQVAATDRGACDADDRVGGFDQMGIGDGFDANVARAIHDGCVHAYAFSSRATFEKICPVYSSSVTCSRQRALLPDSSTSHI